MSKWMGLGVLVVMGGCCAGSLKVALTQLEPQEPHFSCVAQLKSELELSALSFWAAIC